MIGKELEWDPCTESVVLYNLGVGKPGSFKWSDHFLGVYKQRFGYDCPAFLPLSERIDNSNCVAVLQSVGMQRASNPCCLISVAILDKDLARFGLCIDRLPDGSEAVYVDENKYVVNKMMQMTAYEAIPSQCANSLLLRCRALLKSTERHLTLKT